MEVPQGATDKKIYTKVHDGKAVVGAMLCSRRGRGPQGAELQRHSVCGHQCFQEQVVHNEG